MNRSTNSRVKSALAAAVLSAIATGAQAANVAQSWSSAIDGTWSDATKWSAGVAPNNAVDTYSVTIGATGTAYAVTLNTPVTINDLTLNSANATLQLTNGTFSVVNSAINLSAGTFLLSNGTLSNSSITLGGGTLVFGTGARFNNVNVNGSITLGTTGAILGVNASTFGGAVNLSGNSTRLSFFGTQTITPTTYNIDGPAAYLSLEGPVGTLTIPSGATVRGGNNGGIWYGFITGGSTNGLINNGTIQADISGAAFTILPSGNHTFTNNGTLIAANSATLNVSALNWSMGPGAAIRTSGGVINLNGSFSGANLLGNVSRAGGTININGNLNNTGNHLQFTATTGDWNLNGGTISGGSITLSGGNLRFNSASNRLHNVVFNGALNLDQTSSRVGLSGSSTFSGAVNLSGNSTRIGFFDTVIAPATTYNVDGASSYISTEGTGTLTFPAGATIRGGNNGGIWYGFFSGGISNTLVNNGLIRSDIAGTTFTIFPSGNHTFINNGTLSSINGATLAISAATWSNSGNINATNSTLIFNNNWSSTGSVNITNSTLVLGGTFSTSSLAAINRSGGTVNIIGNLNNTGNHLQFTAATGDWNLNGGTISGGSITLSGGNLRFTSASNRLHNVAFNSALNLDQPNTRVAFSGASSISGVVNLSGNSTRIGFFDTMTAPATTYNVDGANSYLSTEGIGTVTFPAGTTIRGGNGGGIWFGFFSGGSNNTVINNGTIQGDIGGTNFTIFPSGNNTFINNGTLLAINGVKMTVNRMSGPVNRARVDGLGSTLRINGTYTINQPLPVLNRATLNLLGEWTLSADIDASGRIIFDYPTAGPSPLNDIRNRIITGRNGGLWNGPGINSSAAASTPLTGLGYAESSVVLGGTGGQFSGEFVDGTAVLVRWTYLGDSNLDGRVDVADLGSLASNWQTNASWAGGDFDYSGFIDVADLGLLASNWQAGVGNPLGPSFAEALASLGLGNLAVPEPGACALVGAAVLLVRRRRA